MVQEVFDEHKLPGEFASKVIEDVPALGWGQGKECTFAGALEAAPAVTERPCKYSDIMGLSGLAFRVRWYQSKAEPGWCLSSSVGEMPEEIAAIQKATGWQLRVVNTSDEDGPQMDRLAADIAAAIDAGRPVLVYPPDLNMAVAYGYEDGGKTLLLRDYMKGETPNVLPTAELGFVVIFLGDRSEPLSRHAALIKALKIAVRNWRRGHTDAEKGKYNYGDAALAAWATDIAYADSLTDEQRESLFFVSWWNYSSMADARGVAVAFLRESTSILDGEAREALKRAAALYDQEGEMFGGVFGEQDAFLGPWSDKSSQDWSADVQAREREILAAAAKTEAAAITEIEEALVRPS